MDRTSRAGLAVRLVPENSALLLIDLQPFQFANLHSQEPTTVINNVTELAKNAKIFGVPTVLTTVREQTAGLLVTEVQSVFPEQRPINRACINAWEDSRVVDAVKKTGCKTIVMAALWTLAMPAIVAQGEGYAVYAVADASAGVSPKAHEFGVRRMIQAGVTPITWLTVVAEWQRDCAQKEKMKRFVEVSRRPSCIVRSGFCATEKPSDCKSGAKNEFIE